MIIELKPNLERHKAEELAKDLKAFLVTENNHFLLINSSSNKSLPEGMGQWAENTHVFEDDIQLASKKFLPTKREIILGNGVRIGGNTQNTLFISGPCSVESEAQIRQCAQACKELGIGILRGGCYKPRTSPYTFQGLGEEGLRLLKQMKEEFGLLIITEIRDATHADQVIEATDIIQIGAKSMYDHGILKKSGLSGKPVLLKRGFGTTLKEFVQMAEFILSLGNPNVMLCERGIRTFETKTRFTLDLCGVAWLQEYTNLPVVVDTSHAMGYAYGVPSLTRAAAAMGVDGLLIESHPNPKVALSDAAQQLSLEELKELYEKVGQVVEAVGFSIV